MSYTLIRTLTCAYQEVRNISFSETFAYVCVSKVKIIPPLINLQTFTLVRAQHVLPPDTHTFVKFCVRTKWMTRFVNNVVSPLFTDSFLVEGGELDLGLLRRSEETDRELLITLLVVGRFSIESFRKSVWVNNLHLGHVDASALDREFLSLLFKNLEKLSLRFFQYFFKNSSKK